MGGRVKFSAYEATKPVKGAESWGFGAENVPALLRRLADSIEAKRSNVHSAKVETVSTVEEFTHSVLTVRFYDGEDA